MAGCWPEGSDRCRRISASHLAGAAVSCWSQLEPIFKATRRSSTRSDGSHASMDLRFERACCRRRAHPDGASVSVCAATEWPSRRDLSVRCGQRRWIRKRASPLDELKVRAWAGGSAAGGKGSAAAEAASASRALGCSALVVGKRRTDGVCLPDRLARKVADGVQHLRCRRVSASRCRKRCPAGSSCGIRDFQLDGNVFDRCAGVCRLRQP